MNTAVKTTPKQMESTYVMIKPDGVKRRLVGEIISRIERKGYNISYIQTDFATEEILREHYNELVSKPFFPGIIKYMTSGPVVKLIVTGHEVVKGMRKLLGATNPREADLGTIRGDLANCVGKNLCHASDSVENAQREIGIWINQELLKNEFPMDDYNLIYEK
ncbi:nucleoside-diphosphate kinase [Nematocida parisii]|uniref:Nucleoside diphosphate kinase n=1 Tax=Nematocida parisii (strain ERTm3) TaxID=935791 RepID=I3EGF4_NEMP3|nr:nucleoside diphosphate kinase 1 [Nematocida parisii ERTm1]EIJ88301.1 nucleoside diphosphate kinase 1 [Nematocida parisii ERTm3]KAI5125430.1 nucleoside-diphosphate kinase [Nematocida parisii]EIJ93633.1 nucleoside diphosphate kinase 1 [Nematocida parisii ERTm1]KAI5125554.1 nucleoside-diphosphate kinase [Nematocida parisii]KAI5141825.1 nucleoside-diphosphate kinase [Nematocida parisii]|eukprot:XP_013059033.1 nucleoside diphosphate kinase 1 [Nematocida parisii ERTm1]